MQYSQGSEPPEDADEATQVAVIAIEADLASAINYACWQNSVPFLRSLVVVNDGTATLSGLRLELTTAPAFAQPRSWTLDRLGPGDEVAISDRIVRLDPEYLAGLDEAERGVVRLRLLDATDTAIAEVNHDIRLLARDEWGGYSAMAAITAAFVMPNDPAVASILKDAAGVLSSHGHSSALDGYQSNDPRRTYMLGAAIWSAVAARHLTYAEPPKSFEKMGQKVRRPGTILDQGLATCFDISLLFAAALEATGLNPFVVLLDGHSFTGFWLTKKTFPNLLETDPWEVRKALAAREAITFETTAITHTPAATFETARSMAHKATTEQEEDKFVAAIDIARARAAQIRPLASHHHVRVTETGAAAVEPAALPLPPPPDFGELPAYETEEKPSTAAGRIEQWQRKLLDLSLRNRLLNFRPTKQTIPFLCPNVSLLEDRLADQARIKIKSLPEQNPDGGRDKSIHLQDTGKDLDTEFALKALQRDELSSPLEPRELDARLTELYRRARNDLNEGGSNTLFLAVGFLRWKKSADDARAYRAPLLLVPIKLERRSASSRFHLLHHEDDVRFNATLLQMLKKDFELDLPQFESELPHDESGIDVPLILETMRRAVRDIAGFEVVDETALSTFSFAKYLMWKDLVDRTDSLRNNRIVKHLIDNPDKPFEPGVSTAFPREHDIDTKYHPKDIFNPLPADSSQLAATMAASEGHDFVLIGPPGTGKSQTITNMIGQCLATGKSVLFVAEKTAALNVVYRRLCEYGLGDYCLELHSNKAERKSFVNQLKTSWEASHDSDAKKWLDVNEQLCVRRDELNIYVEALHRLSPSGWTVFNAVGVSARGRDSFAPELSWDDSVDHDENALKAFRQLVCDLALTWKSVRPVPALNLVNGTDWSVMWQRKLIDSCANLAVRARALQSAAGKFCATAGLDTEMPLSFSQQQDIAAMARLLGQARGVPLAVAFEDQFGQLKNSIGNLEEAIQLFSKAEAQLSASYSDDVLPRIPIDELERQWREAATAFWPLSALGRRRVRKLLASYAREKDAEPSRDLAELRVMQLSLASVEENPLRNTVPAWNGIKTNIENLRDHFDKAESVRIMLAKIAKLSGDINAIAHAVHPALAQGQTDLPIFDYAEALCRAMTEFEQAAQTQRKLKSKLPEDAPGVDFLASTISAMDEIKENETALQTWAEWCRLREKAKTHALMPLVDALESGALASDGLSEVFELAYARWWLPRAIDGDVALRQFKGFRHEDILRHFRDLDETARNIAAAQVRHALSHDLPKPHEVPRKSELGLLRHQMELQRPSKSIREMISAMPESFGKLAPCLLMSPLSIAQYLPAGQPPFDIVIFDEASQIATWDAVGSIARGKQTVIVGDPKQLPPTNFFGRSDQGEDVSDVEVYERDLDSILDEAKASGLPVMQLNWHYRSRHESLIAFSNWHYYQNRLITFPSPVTRDRAVRLEYLPNGVYDRGKSRTNRIEAEAIVNDASRRMVEWLELPEDKRPTLGVITFNVQQQSLIDDLFDQARRNNPAIEWFFSDDRIEPAMVRNLENVQGDERDVMLFSITFGPDQAGKITMSFGAVNNDGGERRLNVAVTRAREELVIYSSITADKINTDRSHALGVAHLKTFLDYAERGPEVLPAQDIGSVGSYDSPFESAVAAAIADYGWTVVPQIGVSGFRIDLGIVHPDKPGAFLAGIECDGATYHSAATARDRDKVREQVLRGLGWEILRIWSPDWWYDRANVLGHVIEELSRLLEVSREAEAERQAEAEARAAKRAVAENGIGAQTKETASHAKNAARGVVPEDAGDVAIVSGPLHDPNNATNEDDIVRVASSVAVTPNQTRAGESNQFRRADLSGIPVDADRFYDFQYRRVLQDMISAVMTAEAPVREDVLAQRIARAHGWQHTGARIRDQILRHLHNVDVTEEESGRFLWQKGTVCVSIPYRKSASEDDARPVSQIALAELVWCVRENPDLLKEPDPALSFARLIGVQRLANASRLRLEAALAVVDQGLHR